MHRTKANPIRQFFGCKELTLKHNKIVSVEAIIPSSVGDSGAHAGHMDLRESKVKESCEEAKLSLAEMF
jgi:hypothetical protein